MKKSKFSTFNDGMLYVCQPETDHTDFNAVKNAAKKEDMKKMLKLAYTEMSKRDQDMDFAESQGRVLTMKVKTRLHKEVTKFHQIMIEDILYSIINLDLDRVKSEMYLYLEEVRRLT